MPRHKFTASQHRENLRLAEAEAERARGSKRFVIDASDIGAAFRQLIGQWHAQGGDKINVEYAFPCGSRLKIVCLHDMRWKLARAAKAAWESGSDAER
jgi:hypothetical protein